MAMFRRLLRAIMVPLGWVCALLALGIPLWFGLAAFGTKWDFFDTATGLGWMTHTVGRKLLFVALGAGAASLLLMLVHRLVARRFFGPVVSPVLALVVAGAGLTWTWQVDRQRATLPPVLDVTTDRMDPPHFSPAFQARRSPDDQSLAYHGKTSQNGQALAALQAASYPDIATVHVARPPEAVFADALAYAHSRRWRVGTASRSAGMFEAGTESLWYGLRDDIVVRIREGDEGGSIVDIRSLSRDRVHDLGRNARRVRGFSAAIEGGQASR